MGLRLGILGDPAPEVSVRVHGIHTLCPSKWNRDQGSTRFCTETVSWVTIRSIGERHFETSKHDDPA